MKRKYSWPRSFWPVFSSRDRALAQFTDPRAYDNTPVATNQVKFSYAYAQANASVDTSLIITGPRLDLDQGTNLGTRLPLDMVLRLNFFSQQC